MTTANNTFLGIDKFYIETFSPYALASAAMIASGIAIASITSAKTAGIALAIFGAYTLLNLLVSAYIQEPSPAWYVMKVSSPSNMIQMNIIVMLFGTIGAILDKIVPAHP